jgi:tetratricopeptide (TPR) repeat protein
MDRNRGENMICHTRNPHTGNACRLFEAGLFVALFAPVVLAKAPERVLLVENHSDVLVPWIQTKVTNAIVVNVDAHDDCLPISAEQMSTLKHLFETNNLAAIRKANGVADSGLYNIADFITAAYGLGIAREAVWAAPLPVNLSKAFAHLPFRVCLVDSLPTIPVKGPVILTVDADIVDHYARYQCMSETQAIRRIAQTVRGLPWDIVHLSVSFSCDGGYLPLTNRWVGNAMQEALEGKDISRPQAAWPMLEKVEDWHRSLPPDEIAKRVKPLVLNLPANPWLRVYLADALFQAGDITGSLAQGKEAARLDPGCCRILAELGGQLAAMDRLDEAERFLNAAPAVVNPESEIALAQRLDRAGQTAKAIVHYSRMAKQVANYSAELLIGYGYERLRDTTNARKHYVHAVELLAKPVSEMAGFANLSLAVAAAEQFFIAGGDQKFADALRRDHRLAIYFNTDAQGHY